MLTLENPSAPPTEGRRTGRLTIFANKYAGTLSRLNSETPLERFAREAGFEPEVVYTNSGIHLRRELRERLPHLERVVIAGGDGTIHSAVQVLAKTDVEVGILPQGTANNFAGALRLPQDLPTAFRVIAEGVAQPVSLGEADGEYFTEGAGVGIFADTLALSNSGTRTKSVLRTLKVLFRLMVTNQPYRIALTVDGERLYEDAFNVTIANGYAVGLNFPIAPNARLTDDVLDVVIIGALQRREWVPTYRALMAQSHLDLPQVRCLQGRHIRIESRKPVRVHVDDRARKKTPLDLRIVPKALNVIVDRL
jgi:YegS/Rv2252/BmrU family lipid kinase